MNIVSVVFLMEKCVGSLFPLFNVKTNTVCTSSHRGTLNPRRFLRSYSYFNMHKACSAALTFPRTGFVASGEQMILNR